MERAVVWSIIILISILIASFFYLIKPAFLRDYLRNQAQRVANYVADQITFMSRMVDQGCVNGERDMYVDVGPDRHLEIVIDDNSKTVIAVIFSGTVSGEGKATYISNYPVIAPQKIFSGNIKFILKNTTNTGDFVIYVTNIYESVKKP
ncbi:MAG: hypothetical protein DSO07_13115 [Thermoproteota archaeon]|uniref:Uncharacterized protein n=1 Tax=Candidatus Methanodesulfokora washburnensis TaxID=2478471 RepID=A0A429GEM7_9CREN|nr:hypothetical protein [Candidatus Methanodesulfokores washburnensis]RSN72254.1 hypothetical protein D6D85_14560 [Candidatus Methanodesulfokores washburnensis]TDA36875.1 MAG: hypothetical protein DSO07_13115 [Candidatus Korarchaeota archaeon]